MLKEEEYFKFIIKQEKMLTDEIKEAIKEQTRLSKIAHEMQDKRDDLNVARMRLKGIFQKRKLIKTDTSVLIK